MGTQELRYLQSLDSVRRKPTVPIGVHSGQDRRLQRLDGFGQHSVVRVERKQAAGPPSTPAQAGRTTGRASDPGRRPCHAGLQPTNTTTTRVLLDGRCLR